MRQFWRTVEYRLYCSDIANVCFDTCPQLYYQEISYMQDIIMIIVSINSTAIGDVIKSRLMLGSNEAIVTQLLMELTVSCYPSQLRLYTLLTSPYGYPSASNPSSQQGKLEHPTEKDSPPIFASLSVSILGVFNSQMWSRRASPAPEERSLLG